jgi:exonuclease 3'-5' domain-containing protein 1
MAEVDLFSDDSDTDSDDESWEDVVYLIDVAILGYDAFARSLKDILEDPGRIKLVFDCRSDADALYHQYGVRLQGVLDVQLLEVASRRAKGYQVLYNASLAKTMSRYGLWGAAEVERKASVHKLCGEVPDVWALRPLTQELVEYASADVARLGHLAQLMAFEVGPEWLLRVWHASQQYADMYRGAWMMVDRAAVAPHALHF